eukprot:TRINITY_DN292_c0_g1_i1.p2 TRINITY_DN292_c0_g1~~TRINITY_DN292_c0_g1_i1.p2  ORF type:complete len:229 (+),score=51.22 TRINITY_DN292_c0_g1_i1:57-743(+)
MFAARNAPVNMFSKSTRDDVVVEHVKNVFLLLTASVLFFAAGIAINIRYAFGSHTLGHLCVVGLAILTVLTPKHLVLQRSLYLVSLAFLEGTQAGPLVALCDSVDPKILPTAAVITVTLFGTFTGSALLTNDLQYIHLYPTLSSFLSTMVVISFIQTWAFNAFLFNIQVVAGIALFAGYLLYDTHKMIAEASTGNLDIVDHAMQFFFDIVGLFIRILALLLKKNDKRK